MTQRFRIPRLILWPLRLMIALLLLAGVALAGVIGWLSSDSGTAYISQLVDEEISPSLGYRLQLKGIGFSFPLTASVDALSLSDDKGVWLEAQKLSVHIIPTPSITEHLIIRKLTIGSFTLLRQPEEAQSQSSRSESSGSMDVSLLSAVIDELSLPASITGLEQPLALKLDTSLHYSGRDEVVDLRSLTLTHPQLALNATANIQLKTNEIIADINSSETNLAAWVDAIKGYATAKAHITGTLDKPSFDASVTARDLVYNEQSIPALSARTTGTVSGSDVSGNLTINAGDAKQLTTRYALAGEQLSLKDILASYEGNKAEGNITLNMQTQLADGQLAITLPDLQTIAPLIPEPSLHSLSGSANASITLATKDAKQSAESKLNLSSIASSYGSVKSVTLNARFANLLSGMPDSATLSAQGIKTDAATINKADATITHKDGPHKGDAWQTSVKADGTAPDPFHISTAGSISQINKEWKVILSSLKADYADIPLQATSAITLTTTGSEDTINAPAFTLAGGQYSLKASRNGQQISAALNGKSIALAKLPKQLPEAFAAATANVSATLSGSMAAPQAKADISIKHIVVDDAAPPVTVTANINATDKQLSVHSTVSDKKSANSTINASLPITFSLEPFAFNISDNAPLKGKADLSLDITALAPLFMPPPHSIKGNTKGNIALSGTVSAPVINGHITFSDGAYSHQELGVSLQKISANLTANGKRFTLDQFHAEDTKGNPVKGAGYVDLSNNSLHYDAKFDTDGLDLFHHPNLQAMIAANLTMKGDAKGGVLGGTITSKEMEIRLPDRFVGNVPELNVVKTVPPKKQKPVAEETESAYPLHLDVTFVADNKVFVRGWGVDAEFKGKLAIKGKAASPDITGKLSTVRGRYEEFGKVFVIKTGELLFEGTIPPAPYLNIITAVKAGDAEVRPTITGPVLKPKLSINSSPSMSQEEALSMLLFGKDTKKISAMQAAQLANSIRKLSGEGGGGFDPLGEIRDMVGVDEIKVNNDGDDDEPSVGVGKYISDDIYLEVERGAEATSGKARIEVEVTPSISVESATGAAGQSSVGLNWKHDY